MTARQAGDLVRTGWQDLEGRTPLVLVPVGAVEQHGPHLPCGTDAAVASALARRVAQAARERLPERDVLLAPTVSYGASGEHEDFPGTVSIGHEALHLLLVELGRSACRWAGGLVFLNAHGGNVATLVSAVRLLREEGRDVAWTTCATPGADAHAGHTETSLMLHLDPDVVLTARAEPGPSAPVSELMAVLREQGVRAVSANGVLGDPAGASAEEGRRLAEQVVERIVAELGAHAVDDTGRLRMPQQGRV